MKRMEAMKMNTVKMILNAEQDLYCFACCRWNKTKTPCQNALKDIDRGNKHADEFLKDRRKFLETELMEPSEFLSFYVGNLHFAVITYQIKKAVDNATGMPVDQVVIAKTSTGESCGCVFVTVRWRDYICITYDCSYRLKQMMKIDGIKYHLKYGNNIWTDAFCLIMSHKRIRGRRIFVDICLEPALQLSCVTCKLLFSVNFQLGVFLVFILVLCGISWILDHPIC